MLKTKLFINVKWTNDLQVVSHLLGIALLMLGNYFLGQNIIFAIPYSPYFWRDIPAAGSVLAIMGVIISKLTIRRQTGNFSRILLGIDAVLLFLSSGIILKPTSLWSFFVAFAALARGFQLMTRGRLF